MATASLGDNDVAEMQQALDSQTALPISRTLRWPVAACVAYDVAGRVDREADGGPELIVVVRSDEEIVTLACVEVEDGVFDVTRSYDGTWDQLVQLPKRLLDDLDAGQAVWAWM